MFTSFLTGFGSLLINDVVRWDLFVSVLANATKGLFSSLVHGPLLKSPFLAFAEVLNQLTKQKVVKFKQKSLSWSRVT